MENSHVVRINKRKYQDEVKTFALDKIQNLLIASVGKDIKNYSKKEQEKLLKVLTKKIYKILKIHYI